MGSITIICCLSLIVASINSLPIGVKTGLPATPEILVPKVEDADSENVTVSGKTIKIVPMNTIRPGMIVRNYHVELNPDVDAGRFEGRVLIVVDVDQTTRDEDLVFHVEDLDVTSVQVALLMSESFNDAVHSNDDGLLRIVIDDNRASMYTVLVEYSGDMTSLQGMYIGSYGEGENYVAMNLHPTNARRVFPCIDEATEASTITFSIDGLEFNNIVANTRLEDNSNTDFRPLGGPPHLWGMIAHNFGNINNPVTNVLLFGRPGVTGQDAQTSITINSVFTTLNEWTEKDYFNIVEGVQEGRMNVFALPDISTDWHSLSIVGVWEPYIFLEAQHSVKQRKEAFIHIAEAIARQWFGYVIYPENWIFEWVITGLGTHAAFEALTNFQTNPTAEDDALLDMSTIFVTDVIQESMLHDSFSSAIVLEPKERIFDEIDVRAQVNGLVKKKAPAIISLLKIVLGESDTDYIHEAVKSLFVSRSLQPVTSLNFIDAVNIEWSSHPNPHINDIEEFLTPYLQNNGYAMLNVDLGPRGVILTQTRFGFGATRPGVTYDIPITYTTALDPNFDNIYPQMVLGAALFFLEVELGEEGWVLFNIQGRGYYRVNYGVDLWERIIMALEDPEEREKIHPLNRATLVDDALNLARAGRLDYDIAFRVVLTMEHETEYAVWKAFIRNMDFIRKRLVAMVMWEDELDPDIYLRMVRRSIVAFENEIGFDPDPSLNEPAMTSLTRGLVMDHACRANYDPCIAAAMDWFYDPNAGEPTVNPNIPQDLRPAVYCTMVRMGDENAIDALQERLDIINNMYERIVILEALACSEDNQFINAYLSETIAENSPYSLEERSRIFIAVAESSFINAGNALTFITRQPIAIRDNYGGPEKLEQIIYALIDNMVDFDLADRFSRWVTSTNSGLLDSTQAAKRAAEMVEENFIWNDNALQEVYEWIEENDANVATISMFLVCLTFALTIFNR